MYVSINFKLESGYYIQDAVSGKLVIMMQTSIVNNVVYEEANGF